MSLTEAKLFKIYKITSLCGGKEVHQRLHDLGFLDNEEVIVTSNLGENLIVNVKGSRIAIDSSLARNIIV